MNKFLEGYNRNPQTSICTHIEYMEKVEMICDELEKHDGKVLRIDDLSIFMTDEQAEQLFEVLEKALFDDSFADIEDKYRSEKARRKKLEEEVEMLKERLSEVRSFV